MKNIFANRPSSRLSEALLSAFTLVELLVLIVVAAMAALLLAPALAHVRPGAEADQCLDNQRQMSRAWKMYADDNNGRLVSAYPNYAGFSYSWCAGEAQSGGGKGSYTYFGSDPAGITNGLLWPYAWSLRLYHCPTDHRLATDASVPAPFKGKPILRSISMNSYMAGTSLGASIPWTITNPNAARDPKHPVYLNDTEIKLPGQTFVFIDEDQNSINDGMFLVDVGGASRLVDLPSRAHRFGFGISFADGHAEMNQLTDDSSKTWKPTDARPYGGLRDWMALTNVTTHPL